jgi:hypothetical protein
MLNNRELATVLAALRYWQREGLMSSGGEHDVATDGDTLEPLTTEEIDALCERINGAPDTPSLRSLVAGAVAAWPQMETGEEMNGGDMVEWFGGFYHDAKAALAAPADPLPRMAIVLEGGNVAALVSDRPELVRVHSVTVIDYDTEGADADDYGHVRQPDGSYSEAFIHDMGIDRAEIDLAATETEDDARDAAQAAGWHRKGNDDTRFWHSDGSATGADEFASWTDLCKGRNLSLD